MSFIKSLERKMDGVTDRLDAEEKEKDVENGLVYCKTVQEGLGSYLIARGISYLDTTLFS